jgi:protein tyrosine phosphatase (PTP) superfamily phosphohydrolase (DUF442 family)
MQMGVLMVLPQPAFYRTQNKLSPASSVLFLFLLPSPWSGEGSLLWYIIHLIPLFENDMQKKLEAINNFLKVSEFLGTAGQPTPGQFNAIKKAGYQVVINLALTDSPGALLGEASLVERLGMAYYHIPVIWEKPDPKDLQRFFLVMDQERDKKIFVHCMLNFRVTAFVYLYRILSLGEPPEAPAEMMRQVWDPDETWQAFIDSILRAGRSGISI